jgi:hypothetical protein
LIPLMSLPGPPDFDKPHDVLNERQDTHSATKSHTLSRLATDPVVQLRAQPCWLYGLPR